MTDILYKPRHLSEAGFFRYLFRALKKRGAAVEDQAPYRNGVETGRHHEGAWAKIEGSLCFFDMSDHVFDFDEIGLREADLYFKANLNRAIAERILSEKGMASVKTKLEPFTFLPPSLPTANRIGSLPVGRFVPGPTLFHVVGVYENPVREGILDPFFDFGSRLEPHVMHFWIRRHFSEAIRGLGVSSLTRLTSRGNREIEDGDVVRANLNHQIFLLRMASAGFTVLNTFPHAVYPWKMLESLALGRPFILEREPLIEIPDAFRPREGTHFLEILPGFGSFDIKASSTDPAFYRILDAPNPDEILRGFKRISEKIIEPGLTQEMSRACRAFARERLAPDFIVDWLKDKVRRGR